MVRARDVAWVVISAEGECDGLLLERGRVLERIGQCLQRGRQGYGGALVVEGPAGIGKTVLLAAGRVAAQGESFRSVMPLLGPICFFEAVLRMRDVGVYEKAEA